MEEGRLGVGQDEEACDESMMGGSFGWLGVAVVVPAAVLAATAAAAEKRPAGELAAGAKKLLARLAPKAVLPRIPADWFMNIEGKPKCEGIPRCCKAVKARAC